MSLTEQRGVTLTRLVRAGKLVPRGDIVVPSENDQGPIGAFEIVAFRSHEWIGVYVVHFLDDDEVWVAWTDGPRCDAEVQSDLRTAMAAFVNDIQIELQDNYFGPEG